MSEPTDPPPAKKSDPPLYALLTAAVLLLLYCGLTIAMVAEFASSTTDADGKVWERALLIYNSFTAFAVVAGSVLLGTQIQQANVKAARRESDAARGEAERVKQAARNALAATEATSTRSTAPADLAEVRSLLVQAL